MKTAKNIVPRVLLGLSALLLVTSSHAQQRKTGLEAARLQNPVNNAQDKIRQPARRKVITNRDLEAARRKRLAEEADYESRRAAQGLPSKEELHERAEERDRRFIRLAEQIEARRVAEEYESLRQELSLLRSQLNLLNTQSQSEAVYADDAPYLLYNSYPLFLTYGRAFPFFRHGSGRHAARPRIHFPRVLNPFQRRAPHGFRSAPPVVRAQVGVRAGTSTGAVRGLHRFAPARGVSPRR